MENTIDKKTLRNIIDYVCEYFEIRPDDIDQIRYETVDNLSELSDMKSTYYMYDSCCASSLNITKYFIVRDNGIIIDVEYAYETNEYGSNYDPDNSIERDIYVGDYINDNTAYIVEYERNYQDYNEYIDERILTIYIPKNKINKEKIKNDIIKKIKDTDDLSKLLEIWNRL